LIFGFAVNGTKRRGNYWHKELEFIASEIKHERRMSDKKVDGGQFEHEQGRGRA